MRLFRRSSRSGFTLIELMVVVVIVAILVSVAVPILMANARRAKMSEAKAGMGAARTQERVYKAEHEVYLAVAAGRTDRQGRPRTYLSLARHSSTSRTVSGSCAMRPSTCATACLTVL